jgi:predicted DNA-binding antitoxin AbrB/MazE fold protein
MTPSRPTGGLVFVISPDLSVVEYKGAQLLYVGDVMAITIEATYENGVLKPSQPLPLPEKQRITVTIHDSLEAKRQGFGLVPWTGSLEDLDYLIDDVENDPLEGP